MRSIEHAKHNVEQTQRSRDGFYEKVKAEYGTLHELNTRARAGDHRAITLRRLYYKSVGYLRMAKHNLAYLSSHGPEEECLPGGEAEPPLMWCPECGALLEIHQDTAAVICSHCRYEEGSR